MNKNPEWYQINIGPVDEKGEPLVGIGLRYATRAGDLKGAEWLAEEAKIKLLANSKQIPPANLTSTVTPCSDC